MWKYLIPPKYCNLQADEVEALTWLMQRNHALAAGSASHAEALSSTKSSQEPQHLQNHSSTFNPPALHIAPISGLEIPNSQDLSSESDGSTESSSDYPSSMDGETEQEDLKIMLDIQAGRIDPAEAIPRSMWMLELINSQIMEAEAELGHQLLACKEPFHRLRSLTQRFYLERRSLEKITSHVGREKYHQICDHYRFQHMLQKRERETVLHPDPEILLNQNKIAMIARAFVGDPAGVLRDILAMQA